MKEKKTKLKLKHLIYHYILRYYYLEGEVKSVPERSIQGRFKLKSLQTTYIQDLNIITLHLTCSLANGESAIKFATRKHNM